MTRQQAPNPWLGIAPTPKAGQWNMKRVDEHLPQNLFWARDDKGRQALLLEIDSTTSILARPPRLRDIELGVITTSSGKLVMVRLEDSEQAAPFEVLCRNLVEAAGGVTDQQEAAHRLIERSRRWHHLLRGGGDGLLSERAQRGLAAELCFLRSQVIPNLKMEAAINAWHGPEGAAQDFHAAGHRIEVKATEPEQPRTFKVSSAQQLDPDDVGEDRLWLAMIETHLHDGDASAGESLPDITASIRGLIGPSNPSASLRFEQLLVSAGYEDKEEYETNRWECRDPFVIQVDDEFPSIRASRLPAAIRGVRYTCDLSGTLLTSAPNPLVHTSTDDERSRDDNRRDK